MKRIIWAALFVLLPSMALCQHFILTPNGMRNSSAPEQEYVVLEFPGKSQQELYDITKDFVVSKFNSPKDVLSESAPNVISIRGTMPFKLSNGVYKFNALMYYKWTLMFKDGRTRTEFLVLDFSVLSTDSGITPAFKFGFVRAGFGNMGIYTKDGKLIKAGGDDTKKVIEVYANMLVDELSQCIIGGVNTDW